MAIMLDGTKIVNTTAKPASTKVTYKPPTQTKTPNNNYYQQQMAEQRRRQEEARRAAAAQQQAAQNAYAQRMQAMADQARKMQQQQKMPEVGWKQNPDGTWNQQTNTGNYKTPVTNPTPQYGMNMNPGQSQQAQNAYAQRYQQQALQYGQQNSNPFMPYHPVTNPKGYKDKSRGAYLEMQNLYGNDWRQQPRFSATMMTPNEWLRRRNAWEKQYGNIFVSETEWQKRNAAAPPGYMWTPFGTGYAKLDTSSQPTAPATDYGGGGGYGDWDYGGGGGGGGGSTYTPKPPEWWVEMVQWRI